MLCRSSVCRVLRLHQKLIRNHKYSTTLQSVAQLSHNGEPGTQPSNEGAGILTPSQSPLLTEETAPTFDPLSVPDFFGVSEMVNVRQLMEARVHLGHKAGMWNPLMKPYIYGVRCGMHIIHLDETIRHLQLALNVAAHIAYRRGVILFVNERSQFEGLNQDTARECGEYFATKWRGGTLTNSYMLLKTLRLPDLIIFLSVPKSKTAIKEAAMANVPSIGVVDTDCNPNLIMYPVPGNDDTPTAVKLYCNLFSDVITKAKKMREEMETQQETGNNSLYETSLGGTQK